jgi:hypothetical protein
VHHLYQAERLYDSFGEVAYKICQTQQVFPEFYSTK